MKGCLASRAAVLFVAFAIGACVVLPLCSSVPVSAVGDSKSLRGKDGSEVATGVTRSGLDVISPEGTSDESGQSQSVSGRKTPVARWRSSSSGFLKRFGKGPKFLLSVSVILGTALLLSRAGNVLLKCLAGMGGRRQRPSEGPESEACDRLREWSENDDQATELAKLLPSGSLRASIPQKVVMTAALLSLIAIALANPITPTVKEEGMKPTTPGTEDDLSENVGSISRATSPPDVDVLQSTLRSYPTESEVPEDDEDFEYEDGAELGSMVEGQWSQQSGPELNNATSTVGKRRKTSYPVGDGTYPEVAIKGDVVEIGHQWKDKQGESKAGSMEALVEFDYKGKHFKVWMSRFTEDALKHPIDFTGETEDSEGSGEGSEGSGEGGGQALEGDLLQKMKIILTNAPANKEGSLFVWGKEFAETLLTIRDDKDKDVPFEMYTPKGAFGIDEQSHIAHRDQYQAWFDVWIVGYHILYVGNKGHKPTPPPPTALPTTAITAAAEGGLYSFLKQLVSYLSTLW
ncbi:hypothetical protein CSUI_009134 [Cystoisospora suis]|uniref:Transmembrane protein n=1 Tax=Cystoisospora suis TaxID=483139 RepID=A0A2C6KKV3_9APIC|nr:hypothetical protein CSUI_009134 [Cystoisospora suis]